MGNLGNQISDLMMVETDRAYSNLFEVEITTNTIPKDSNIPSLQERLKNMKYLVKKVSFQDDFGFEMDYNEAIQAFSFKGPQRIKGVSLTFKETSHYRVIDVLKDWINAIYDFTEHVFIDGINPTGTLKIIPSDGVNTGSLEFEDAIIKSLSYPGYDWSTSTPLEIEASFSVGKAIWSLPKRNG